MKDKLQPYTGLIDINDKVMMIVAYKDGGVDKVLDVINNQTININEAPKGNLKLPFKY